MTESVKRHVRPPTVIRSPPFVSFVTFSSTMVEDRMTILDSSRNSLSSH
jgi:hypothetical protein